jgi:citronellol/citronellal dehydrogenase
MYYKGKTIFITGASRGIGKAIALRLAREGANIVIAAKSVIEDLRLGGTIYTAADEVNNAGGKALAVPCDIRDEDQIIHAVQQASSIFGGIDAVINNASAISLTTTEQTETKRFDLIHDINVRGTFLVTKHCIPFLKKAANPHILTLSPPLNMNLQWFGMSLAYTLSKYNMSMMTLGWSAELSKAGIAANAVWPVTTIATSAVKNLLGGDMLVQKSRRPDILADAVHYILQQPSKECTGNLFTDEEVLQKAGIHNFDDYAIDKTQSLQKDFFID